MALILELKMNYMGKGIIKLFKIPLQYIGDIADWMELKDSCN